MISNKISNGINGNPIIPGDKSISHRSIIIPSISNGLCVVKNYLKSDDVINTLNAFISMGVKIEENSNEIIIHGKGLNSLKKPIKEIYLGNSGTSARLLTGLLASQKFDSILTGDSSLSSRPMGRISKPLEQMNAEILTNNGSMPIKIIGRNLINSEIEINIPSAQIKSGLILAALNTKGKSKIIEHNITRDHTEIMLEYFGADILIKKDNKKKVIQINGKKELKSKNIDVPSDLSSSAFFIVAALINKNSHIILKNINVNPTRNGILIALEKMGGKINYLNTRFSNNEKICDIEVKSSTLNGCELGEDISKLMIDEYPILSIAASFAKSPSVFRGLNELRVKESDRLKLININLLNCGVDNKIADDDLYIYPSENIEVKNNNILTDFDHRIAMAFTVMGSKIGPLDIADSDSINTSFPTFVNEFVKIGGIIS
tara:strand:- start:11609 stop:12907 length:1299 start_codon:yes stop_codon:yes gene_type:complete